MEIGREELVERKERRRGAVLCRIFQKGNYKSELKTREAAIKRDLYETRGPRGSSLKGKK